MSFSLLGVDENRKGVLLKLVSHKEVSPKRSRQKGSCEKGSSQKEVC